MKESRKSANVYIYNNVDKNKIILCLADVIEIIRNFVALSADIDKYGKIR